MNIDFESAVNFIRSGRVIAIPTDTIYGLAASLENVEAICQLFVLKQRPPSHPLIIQLAGVGQICQFTTELPESFHTLASHFWPGPLSLVIPIVEESIPAIVRAGGLTCGFRISKCPLTLKLIKEAGPLVVPSANLHGHPSATCVEHIEKDFGENFPVLEGESAPLGLESTVLIYQQGKWGISRRGAVLDVDLENILGYIPTFISESKPVQKQKAKTEFILSNQPYDGAIKKVLGFEDRLYPGAESFYSMGRLSEPQSVAKGFYNGVRKALASNSSVIWVDMNFPFEGILSAVAARLLRALSP